MKINILRGQNQIGGSIIEISTDSARIVFDVGINLDESENIEIPKIDGLFYREKKYDAVFISHYHPDHVGLIDCILTSIPIYMGETAYKILEASNAYREIKQNFAPNYLYGNKKVSIGDIVITPILCDHSAFDSYMFLIESDKKKILYTGDFRANGRLDFEELINCLPTVDALIIEGTTLSREKYMENIREEFLEDIAIKAINQRKGPAFIMMSAMNIDRLITAYNVAKSTDRIFLEDIYTAEIAKAAGGNIPQPNGKNSANVFITGGYKQYNKLQQFGNAKIGKTAISKTPFLMCVRPSMKNYLSKLSEMCSFKDGILFYGMWKGYMDQPYMNSFIQFMESKGVKLHALHTSGHADNFTLDKLIETVKPQKIIPVHTENEKWFDKFSKNIEIIYNSYTVI